MEKIIFYKLCYPNSVVLFYHDKFNDKLGGIIEEIKSKNRLTIRRHESLNYYDDVSNNKLASSMINKAKRISDTEYEIAKNVVEAMVDSEEWLIAENEIAEANETKNEVVTTETVYV